MLFAAEALVIVAFTLEELLEVRFAVELPLEGRKAAKAVGGTGVRRSRRQEVDTHRGGGAKPELGVAVFAAEAAGVEDLVVGHQPLHGVDSLLTVGAHLLLGLEAERLGR